MKSPECRQQRRRADLRHFEIFKRGPIIIYTRLPTGGTYHPVSTFPASSECLIGISYAFSAFCLRVSVIFPTCSLYPQQKRAYSALHPQAWTNVYRSMPEGSYRVQSLDFRRSSIIYILYMFYELPGTRLFLSRSKYRRDGGGVGWGVGGGVGGERIEKKK